MKSFFFLIGFTLYILNIFFEDNDALVRHLSPLINVGRLFSEMVQLSKCSSQCVTYSLPILLTRICLRLIGFVRAPSLELKSTPTPRMNHPRPLPFR